MSDLNQYKVLRQLDGTNRRYNPGDFREMTPSDAKQLLDLGALEDHGPVQVSATVDAAKSEGAAPMNKAEPDALNKAGPVTLNKADPLDHDGDGKKGGSIPAKAKQ